MGTRVDEGRKLGKSIVVDSEVAGWQTAHEALTRLVHARARLDWDEGQKLQAAHRAGAHERLGYGSFVEYIERLFGYGPRLTLEKLRVAEALAGLPHLTEALRSGRANWSCVRELTRVATPETERAWCEAARGSTVREVERLVSGRKLGDLPDSPRDWRVDRHVLRFEVCGEVAASFREALVKLRRDAGEPLDDDAALLLMARQILAGPADAGRASYQVALTVCEACGFATQKGNGEPAEVTPEVVEMAQCDAQEIRHTHVGTKRGRASQTVPPAVRRTVLLRDQHRCQVPGCRHATFVDVHHLRAREDGGDHQPDNLVTLCSAHHRACHRGELLIERRASGTLVFRHAEGTTYGHALLADAAVVTACAFRALRNLGFAEREAHQALKEAATHVGEHLTAEGLIRSALEWLTRHSWEKAS